jgi:hypothetical protein
VRYAQSDKRRTRISKEIQLGGCAAYSRVPSPFFAYGEEGRGNFLLHLQRRRERELRFFKKTAFFFDNLRFSFFDKLQDLHKNKVECKY